MTSFRVPSFVMIRISTASPCDASTATLDQMTHFHWTLHLSITKLVSCLWCIAAASASSLADKAQRRLER